MLFIPQTVHTANSAGKLKNIIAKFPNLGNNGARMMEFDSIYGEKDDEHNSFPGSTGHMRCVPNQ